MGMGRPSVLNLDRGSVGRNPQLQGGAAGRDPCFPLRRGTEAGGMEECLGRVSKEAHTRGKRQIFSPNLAPSQQTKANFLEVALLAVNSNVGLLEQ